MGGAAPIFGVEVAQQSGSVRVNFTGELDVLAAAAMRDALMSPELAGSPSVLVDLTDVTFLDSIAIGILVTGCRRIRSEGASFSVTCPDGMPRQVLSIAGLTAYLNMEPPSVPPTP